MAQENGVPDRSTVQEGIDAAKENAVEAVDREAAKKAKKAEKAAKVGKKDAKSKDQTSQQKSAGGKAKEGTDTKGITTKKEEDFSAWYLEVIQKAELCDYSDVPGFFILPPGSYAIWEYITDFFNRRIKGMEVDNVAFPFLIAEERLATEKEHLEGFAAEVAWVTHGGKDQLHQRYAIRPTSETAMYPYYAKRIRSHQDLPLKYNQWNSVVRWEMKHAIPFLRSREFYWQEGHTAHLTKREADQEVLQILDHYAAIYQELLAVPVVRGTKTDNEKFAGSLYTTTCEGFIPAVGRGIQAATSHCLGQHFSEMFNITVQDPNAEAGEDKPPLHVWQNSWGFSTRSIGVMVMTHSDNKGVVLPPRVAKQQVVMVPLGIKAKTAEADKQAIYAEVEGMRMILKNAGLRVFIDKREGYTPGWKFADWELKGVPLRIEFGPQDRENHVITVSRRDTGEKSTIPIKDIATAVPALLETIHADMYKKAEDEYRAHRKQVESWDNFVPTLNAKNVCLIRHCLGGECEDQIKDLSRTEAMAGVEEDKKAPSMGAKSLCIPFEQPSAMTGDERCTNPKCEAKAQKWVLFGRSY